MYTEVWHPLIYMDGGAIKKMNCTVLKAANNSLTA
jgi:hypothetical protein